MDAPLDFPLAHAHRWLELLTEELDALQPTVPFPVLRRELLRAGKHLGRVAQHLLAIEALVEAGPRPPLHEVDARPSPSRQVASLPSGCPEFVWTLHLVPGRLNDLPLAVRRRVLSCSNRLLQVELAHCTILVDHAALEAQGRARSRGESLHPQPGQEPLLWVYLGCPSASERMTWRERRCHERTVLTQKTFTFWTTVANSRLGGPDIAVPCQGERRIYSPEGVEEYDTRGSTWTTWQDGERERHTFVDLFALIDDGYEEQDHEPGNSYFSWELPGQDVLQRLGRDRAEREAAVRQFQEEQRRQQEERQRAEQRRLEEELRRACNPTGAAALTALGLTMNSTEADVRRAFGKKVFETGAHPDQGGSHEEMLRWRQILDEALSALKQKVDWDFGGDDIPF